MQPFGCKWENPQQGLSWHICHNGTGCYDNMLKNINLCILKTVFDHTKVKVWEILETARVAPVPTQNTRLWNVLEQSAIQETFTVFCWGHTTAGTSHPQSERHLSFQIVLLLLLALEKKTEGVKSVTVWLLYLRTQKSILKKSLRDVYPPVVDKCQLFRQAKSSQSFL